MAKERHVVAEVPADRLLSTDEVGKVLGGTDRYFVNRLINAGMLLALYVGRSKRVPTSVLNRFIAEHVGRDIVKELEAAEAVEASRKAARAAGAVVCGEVLSMWVWHGRVMDRVIVAVGLALCALVYMGGTYAEESGQRLVETTYTVQTGDTLWSVSEAYLKKNTGGRRYILEFEEGIKELNPWLLEREGWTLYPGDKLRVNYWVKEELRDDG